MALRPSRISSADLTCSRRCFWAIALSACYFCGSVLAAIDPKRIANSAKPPSVIAEEKAAEALARSGYDDLLDEFDDDGDGHATLAEIEAMLEKEEAFSPELRQRLRQNFARVDADKDGRLTVAETERLFRLFEEQATGEVEDQMEQEEL
eukprot:TRINITY_DN51196_c0_g1_i1.p1 TRINITY_DN51196_c0_g1~~TRINITY_DN51196_c0_g1_i1.p1  ORF type:complete len:167 (+),score=53.29 TRINITY_DN51196_c0_g1_i1:54-503(+)